MKRLAGLRRSQRKPRTLCYRAENHGDAEEASELTGLRKSNPGLDQNLPQYIEQTGGCG